MAITIKQLKEKIQELEEKLTNLGYQNPEDTPFRDDGIELIEDIKLFYSDYTDTIHIWVQEKKDD